MASHAQVFNYSRNTTEPAADAQCPRCTGFGGVTGDEDGCTICEGDGRVMLSTTGSGFLRRKRQPIETSRLY